MVEVSLTVGKLDASLALLLTKDHHLIEFPTILLPNGVKAGSIVKIRCDRDLETEQKERKQFQQIQDEILATYGKNLPQNPVLRTKNVTQTSCVLAWDPLNLGTASLKSLILYKDGKKLGAIPNPLNNHTTKLSGLSIDKTIHFQLRLDSTAGIYSSETIEVTTHKMTDLSGINVCLGDIFPNGQFSIDDIQDTLKNMGARYPASNKVQVETTHFIATRENKQNEEYSKANEMNIPVIRPEWLKACERERRIVGVRDFYVKDCVLPDIMAKNYWKDSTKAHEPAGVVETAEPADTAEAVETTKPADTVKPVDAAEPVETAEPVGIAEPADKAEPVDIAEPADKAEPVDTTKVIKPEPNATTTPATAGTTDPETASVTDKDSGGRDGLSAHTEVADKVDGEHTAQYGENLSLEPEGSGPGGATGNSEPAEPIKENVPAAEDTSDVRELEPLSTEQTQEKKPSSTEERGVELQSKQAVEEPKHSSDEPALEETAETGPIISESENFIQRDISLENVAVDENSGHDGDSSDLPPPPEKKADGKHEGISEPADANNHKEKSPQSLEEVEL